MKPSHTEVWREVDQLLREQLGPESHDSWFTNVSLDSLEGKQAVLKVPSSQRLEWIERHYRRALQEIFRSVVGHEVRIHFRLATQGSESGSSATARQIPAAELLTPPDPAKFVSGEVSPSSVGLPLNPKYRFDTFIVGDGNRLTHAYARAVAENKPGEVYNPLYIHGGVGLGKTHLMQAMGHLIQEIRPGLRVAYLDAETFVNEFVTAIQKKSRYEFQERFRNQVDVLLVDDIHFLAGKDATQEEFFHTFNSLYNNRKQIVLSSDCHPKDLSLFTERLRSRFAGGLTAEILPPDLETREAILLLKCDQEQLRCPREVIRLIAQRVSTSIRELEGALVRLAAHARFTGSLITLDLAQHLLRDLGQDDQTTISIERIQKIIADHFRLKTADLLGQKRNRSIALPRRIAMYLARTLTNHSFPEIGVFFGNKDHSTVIHACHKVKADMDTDPAFAETIEQLTQLVRNSR